MAVLTPLPDGGYAEYAWQSITDVMRRTLFAGAAAVDHRVRAHPRTLLGLVRRDLVAVAAVSGEYYVTVRGMALVAWAKETER